MRNQPLQLQLAYARAEELRRSAEAHRRGRAARRVRPVLPPRQRAGWWLVTLGLRLAVGSAATAR